MLARSLIECPHCGSGLVDLLDDDIEKLLEDGEEGSQGGRRRLKAC